MKKVFIAIFLLIQQGLLAQENPALKIIDLSQMQIRLLNAGKYMDSAARSKIYADSVYRPYKKFWSLYAGDEETFLDFMNKEGVVFLDYLNERNKAISGERLINQFNEVKEKMMLLTGYEPKGEWYIVYFHGVTNLGGFGNEMMVIDLSHESNASNENIMQLFPHEITHQIMTNVNKHNDTTAMGSIIGEGFAVFMNQLYWKDKFTLAENLGFTEDELTQCAQQGETIKKYFTQNKFSGNKAVIDSFRNRYVHIAPGLPGAIGYYIGYRIIEGYVSRHGKDSWKDVFIKPAKEIYELSGY